MRLSDVNLLLYAYDTSSPHHERARPWLEERLSSIETFGFAWPTMLAFVRLVTNPRLLDSPVRVDEALDVVDAWLAPLRHSAPPRPATCSSASAAARASRYGGQLATDAHLAALALEHDAELCSADADFPASPGFGGRVPWPGSAPSPEGPRRIDLTCESTT